MVKCTTKKQFEELVRIMEANPNVGRGVRAFGQTKASTELVWAEVSTKLNSYGPPVRTSDEWQRVWIHYKAKLKKKMAKNKKSFYTTGGGPSEEVTLSPLEQAVVDLLQMDLVVDPSGNIFGSNQKENTPEPQDPEPEMLNKQQEEVEPQYKEQQEPQKKKIKIDEKRFNLLQEQTVTQNELVKTMNNIEKHLDKKNEILNEIKELKQKKYNALLQEQVLNAEIKKKKLQILEKKLQNLSKN